MTLIKTASRERVITPSGVYDNIGSDEPIPVLKDNIWRNTKNPTLINPPWRATNMAAYEEVDGFTSVGSETANAAALYQSGLYDAGEYSASFFYSKVADGANLSLRAAPTVTSITVDGVDFPPTPSALQSEVIPPSSPLKEKGYITITGTSDIAIRSLFNIEFDGPAGGIRVWAIKQNEGIPEAWSPNPLDE